jgi:hypothetical protein
LRSKLLSTIPTALFAAALLLTAVAQNPKPGTPNPPRTTATQSEVSSSATVQGNLLGKRTKLPCRGVTGGDVASTVRVTNNTGHAIPKLTVIYFSTSNGAGKQALSNAMANAGPPIWMRLQAARQLRAKRGSSSTKPSTRWRLADERSVRQPQVESDNLNTSNRDRFNQPSTT